MIVGTIPDARALELFGTCLIEPCKADEDNNTAFIDPKNYDVELDIDPATPDGVVNAIKTASELWRGRDGAVAGSAGLIARAKGDYRRILAALYNSGRYAGEIAIELNGQEAANLRAGHDAPQRSAVSIRVNPGPRYLFSRAEIINNAPTSFDPKDQTEHPADIGFAVGQVAKASVVQQAALLSREAWRQQGYATAKVVGKSATANHPAAELGVAIEMDPGPHASYGELTVSGTESMDPDFVAYMTGLKPGDEFDPDDLKRAYRRLDRLGVFSTRKIEEALAVSSNGLLPLHLMVQERKLRRIGVGVTASSVDGAGVEAYWLHRNLFGKAERLRLDAKLGGVGATTNPDKFDYFLGANLIQPGVFTPDTDLAWNAYGKREFNETFAELGAGASVNVTNYWSEELTFSGGFFGEYGRFDDVFGTRRFITTGLQGDVIFDSRDSKLHPTRGIHAQFRAKPFYEWQFGNPAARLEGEARSYLAFDDEGHSVVAGRVKVGSLFGVGVSQIPPSFLFTAGGGSSVRGFAYKSIGVPAGLGQVSGGKSLFEASLELRQRIAGNFGVVGFVDAGTVGASSLVDFSQDLRMGAGIGLRYHTSLGPIRLDVAVPLDRRPGEDRFAVYAGIGQAF